MFEQEMASEATNHLQCQARHSHADLVRRVRAGDASAFAELVHAFHTPLCTYLARLVGNDELGRDLAQETFLLAWTSLSTLREEQHFKAWLYRIATNLAQSHLRRARLMRWLPWAETTDSRSQQALRIAGPEEQASETELIKKTLARLSPRYRTCLLLQVVAGFSQREIALLLKMSEKSVSSNVCRARDQFRQIYCSLKGDLQ